MIRWLLLTAAFPLLMSAQGGRSQGGRALLPWWENPVVQDLNLTDAQRGQIRAVVTEYRNRLVDERAAVDKAEGDLEDVFGEETVDQHKAAEALDRLTAARAELTKSLGQMSFRMRTVLTAEQWQNLQQRQGGRGARGQGKNFRRRTPPGSVPPQAPNSPSGAAPPTPPAPPAKQL